MISPVISTISHPNTLLVVMPYFRQCTPPEFSATLPPIEQDLRGRIGCVVESGLGDGVADGEICYPRLGHHRTVVEIDLADAVEFAQAEQHAVGERQRAAGQR